MHEYGIAQDIVRQAVAKAERWRASRIITLHIGIGAAESIEWEAFIFSIQAAAADTIAEGASVEISKERERGIVLERMEVEEAS